MTCQEIRAHFREGSFAGVNPAPESEAWVEHVAKCGECSRFVEEQEELAKGLLLFREGCPAVSASLDAAVLNGYRSYIAEQPRLSPAVASTMRIEPLGVLRWAAGMAFALVAAAAVLLLISGGRGRVDRVSIERPRLMVSPEAAKVTSRTAEPGSIPRKLKSTVGAAKHASTAIPVAPSQNWASTNFQGLMYCDQLSCPAPMDVIRVQLPSAAVGFGPTSSKASDTVYADVLVGPDGIARGIRVVE